MLSCLINFREARCLDVDYVLCSSVFLQTGPAVAKGVVYVIGALDWTFSLCVAITTLAMETRNFLITLGVDIIFKSQLGQNNKQTKTNN